MMADPKNPDGWLALAMQHEEAAKLTVESKIAANQSYFHSVMAVECALKALVWHRERFNAWPSRDARPDLYRQHNIPKLMKAAAVAVDRRDKTAGSWATLLNADRNQYHEANAMPRSVARAMFKAAFGENGVVTWIRQTLRPAS